MTDNATNAVLALLRAHSSLDRRLGGPLGDVHGLSLNELLLMMHLDQAPGGRLRRVDLAERLHLAQSSVTRMVGPMEKIGLVARDNDPRDARVAYVVLTAAGRRRVREATETLCGLSESLFEDRWTDQEIRTLGALLGRLTTALPGRLAVP